MKRTMQQRLEDHHQEILRGIAEIRQHCQRPAPDIAALGTARLCLSRASSARAHYVRDILIPALMARADADLRTELSEMERGIGAKRLVSSQHVTTWSARTIAEDWTGYRTAARDIWAMMEEQIARERRVLGERLGRMGL